MILQSADSSFLGIPNELLWIFGIFAGAIVIYGIRVLKKYEKTQQALAQQQKEEERIKELTAFLSDKEIPFFKVKGTTFYEPKKPGLYICQLVAEPENPYDPLAVKVEHPTLGTIGHLPKGNTYLHNLAKTKTLLGATQIGIHKDKPYAKFYIDPSIFSTKDIAYMEDLTVKGE